MKNGKNYFGFRLGSYKISTVILGIYKNQHRRGIFKSIVGNQ